MIDWPRIEQFIGYGRLDAPVVFVGMEEGLADEAGLQNDLLLRSRFEPVMDSKEALCGIVGGEALFSETPRRQPTWRVMADVMLHFDGQRFSSPAERSSARKSYRATRLGRSEGETLLTELLPYPHRNTGSWLYVERYKDREAYVAAILPARLTMLHDVLGKYPRKAIICYGRADWGNFKRLFPDATPWKSVDRFQCAEWREAKVTLTDHFVTKHFNTDAQLDELSAVALP